MPIDGLLRVYAKTNVLLLINVLRLVMIALLIQWAIRSLGLVGAMLVTVAALAAGKGIGLAAAGSLWRVGAGRLLPWRALSSIALVSVAASLPALAAAYGLHAAPFLRILVIGTLYGCAYAVLALSLGLVSPHERETLSRSMGRFQFLLPVRYQHKPS